MLDDAETVDTFGQKSDAAFNPLTGGKPFKIFTAVLYDQARLVVPQFRG